MTQLTSLSTSKVKEWMRGRFTRYSFGEFAGKYPTFLEAWKRVGHHAKLFERKEVVPKHWTGR
jgi:hypothetical protein